MQVFPFFIECSKYYNDQPQKQRLLQQLAFGRGGFMILRKNVLVTPEGEFKIPPTYSDAARLELDQKLWKQDDFSSMNQRIKDTLSSWTTVKKKDKIYLFYKFVASLQQDMRDKMIICSLLVLAHLMKLIKPNDLTYDSFNILHVKPDLLEPSTYNSLSFSYDYSFPVKKKQATTITTTISEEDDDE